MVDTVVGTAVAAGGTVMVAMATEAMEVAEEGLAVVGMVEVEEETIMARSVGKATLTAALGRGTTGAAIRMEASTTTPGIGYVEPPTHLKIGNLIEAMGAEEGVWVEEGVGHIARVGRL